MAMLKKEKKKKSSSREGFQKDPVLPFWYEVRWTFEKEEKEEFFFLIMKF